jgi:GT2 family glycosyltransferase/tetratricopeptide (TPR) repeat protein
VIIPTFNRPERLAQAIQSVLAQSYPCVEIIVVNDGGRELEEVVTRYNVGRQITYIRHARNLDRAAARNTGLKVARGKYIAYLDDDDRFLPNHVQVLVEFLESHDFRVAYTDAWRVHEERQGGRYVETGRDAPYSYDFDATKLLVSNYIPVLSVMHERACLEEVGLFDESLTSHEDWDLWIRLSRVYPFAHLKEFTAEFTWRADGSTTTSRNRKDFVRTAEMVYRKHRSLSEHLPNVCAGQVQALRELRELTEGQEHFTCSIIIPVWNKQELTQQCLSSLAEVTDAVDYEVIVVDNGSTDGTQHFLGQLAGDLRIIRNNENLGFAKACNQGAKAARGEFLVFLNNDTVPLKGWLSALVEEVRSHADVGVVGSKLLYEDGTIQHAGVAFSREWYVPYHIYRGVPADAPQVSRRREFKCVTAACMLVRREAFFSAGGFDEGYRNGFEDVDLCLQIGQRNWKVIYQPKSVLYHLESRTPGRKTHEKDNSRRLLDRWGHCWWLPDEDWVHLEDGYELHTMVKGDQLSYRLQPINDDHARAQRTVVADAQRAAHRQDREAVAALLRRAAEWPADVWILRWAALLCVGVGHPELAPRFWDRVLALEEDDRARVALAKCALTQNDLPGAESHLSTLLEHHPEHGEGWLLSGILAMQRHQFSAASTAFGRAIQYGADRRKAWLGIAMASVGEQRFEPAWDAASTLCREYPDDEECMHWLLRCGTALERWDPLDGYLKTFIGRNPGNLAMRFARAGVLLRRGRRDEARDEYERLRLLDATFEGLDDLALQLRDSGRQTVTGHAAC